MAEHSTMPGRRRWRRWVVWAVLLVICGGLVLADTALDLDTVRRQRAWQAERRAHVVRAQEVRWLLMNRIEPALGGSVEAIEGQWRLDGVRKVSLGTSSDRYVVPGEHFHGDAAGFTAHLSFANDRLTSFSITPPPGPPRPTLTAWVYFHRATIGLALAATGAWLTFVLAALSERSRMVSFGEAALWVTLLALTAGTIWQLGPYGGSRPLGFAAQFVGLLMVTVSVGLLVRGLWPRGHPDDSRCARCRYDLTGNESGVCPECGEHTPAGLRAARSAEAEAIARTPRRGAASS